MKKLMKYVFAILFTSAFMAFAIMWPSILSEYKDAAILGKVYTQETDSFYSGYKYKLSDWDRVFIYSNARENLAAVKRYTAASLKMELLRIERTSAVYENEAYALFINEKGPGADEFSAEEAAQVCLKEIDKLKAIGVLPDITPSDEAAFEADLYSVVNISETSKNISVWELYNNLDMQFQMDAETGKIYGFTINYDIDWNSLNTRETAKKYCGYLGINEPQEYTQNDMTERTPYFTKYISQNKNGQEIFITIGFNPADDSFFIRLP